MTRPTNDSASQGDRRVFLVDDERGLLRATRLALRSFASSWTVDTFVDPHEAFLASFAARPQVVVTDYHMPGGTGADLARALRGAYGASCPMLVLVTGEPSLRRSERALFDAVYAKPLAPRHLAFHLRSLRGTARSSTMSAAETEGEGAADTGTDA